VSIIIPGLRYDFKSINLLNGISFITSIYISLYDQRLYWGRRGRDRMVVGFTTTNAIGAYHHWCCKFDSCSRRGVQHYVIKFVSDLRQGGGFLHVLRLPPPRYNWNIVESGVKHHKTNKQTNQRLCILGLKRWIFIHNSILWICCSI
jgi:hypothetical protein